MGPMPDTLVHYTAAFRHLHTNINRTDWSAATGYRAPHKMLLLLAVTDLAEQGDIARNFIDISPALLEQFAGYWSAIMPPARRGDIFKPFFHLQHEGFWHLVPKPGREPIAAALRTPHSMRDLTDNFLGATLDEDLFRLLQGSTARSRLRDSLLSYFAEDLRQRLVAWTQVNRISYEYAQQLVEHAHEHEVADAPAVPPPPADDPARDQGFRRAVVTAYEHRCSFCGIRMLTPQGHTVVDAAHIMPWSESRNDDIRNGLALCKLCHWAFDELLISVSARCRILTSPVLGAYENLPGHLLQMRDREMLVPSDPALHPAELFLAQHRGRFCGN